MKNNEGLSLVELIIVVSIMAVLIGFISIGFNVVSGMDAKECANDLNAYLKETKTSALSKDYQELKIYVGADGKSYVDFVVYQYQDDPANPGVVLPDPVPVVSRTELIGKSSVSIQCKFSDGSLLNIGTASGNVTLGFDRASGAFTYAKINDIQTSLYCTQINITKKSRSYTIELIPSTGKQILK